MKQWRVSWMMWPYHWNGKCSTHKDYEDETEARDHIKGLLSMQAPHTSRKCDKHVWSVKLEERDIGEWKVKP